VEIRAWYLPWLAKLTKPLDNESIQARKDMLDLDIGAGLVASLILSFWAVKVWGADE